MSHRWTQAFALTVLVALASGAPLFAQHRRTRGHAAAPPPGAAHPLFAALHTAARCPSATSPFRFWCIAADGFATGTAAPLPAQDVMLLGLTLTVAEGESVETALMDNVTLSSLALRHGPGGITGKINSISPSNPDEARQMSRTAAYLAAVFKGLSATAEIDGGLADFLASLQRLAAYPVRRGQQGWLIAGASNAELRRVGDYWVALEVPRSGRGAFLSMFTDRYGPQH